MATTTNPKLSLKIANQTNGFSEDDIFLVIQGKINGIYNRLDWLDGKFKTMSTADNTLTVNYLGADLNQEFAVYGKKLSDILRLPWVDKTNKSIPIPVPVEGGRAYISFNQPVHLRVNTEVNKKTGQSEPVPVEPADEVPTDPNFGTIWDKFEFTVTQDKDTKKFNLWSNTSCVDFVGIPMTFELEKSGNKKGPQGFDFNIVSKTDPMSSIRGKFSGTPFEGLASSQRIYAPKVSGSHFEPDFGKKGNYIKNYLDFCWQKYASSGKKIILTNNVEITKAENNSLAADDKSCKWKAEGSVSGQTLSFSLIELLDSKGKALSFPSPNKFSITLLPSPSQQGGNEEDKRSNSYDTLRQGGIFTKDEGIHALEYTRAIDGDIKNQVSTALNRLIMHDDFKATIDGTEHWWADANEFYKGTGITVKSAQKPNLYAKVLHELSIDKKCYALAYDDKYGHNVNISEEIDDKVSTLSLNLFYKNNATSLPAWGPKQSPHLEAGIEQSTTIKDMVVVWAKPLTNFIGKIPKVFFMYPLTTNPMPNPDKYSSSEMQFNTTTNRFELLFAPGAYPSPFKFYLKYSANGVAGEPLLPTDAISGNNPAEYPDTATS